MWVPAQSQGPDLASCPHSQVGDLLWRSQSEPRQVRLLHVQEVRCPDVRGLTEKAVATLLAPRIHGHRAGTMPHDVIGYAIFMRRETMDDFRSV